jgi:hypothetical protein
MFMIIISIGIFAWKHCDWFNVFCPASPSPSTDLINLVNMSRPSPSTNYNSVLTQSSTAVANFGSPGSKNWTYTNQTSDKLTLNVNNANTMISVHIDGVGTSYYSLGSNTGSNYLYNYYNGIQWVGSVPPNYNILSSYVPHYNVNNTNIYFLKGSTPAASIMIGIDQVTGITFT